MSIRRASLRTSSKVRLQQRRQSNRQLLSLESLERRNLLATITWSGAVNFDWGNAGNWVGGVVPGVADVARFTDGGAGTINLGGARDVGGVQFENTGIGSTLLQEQFETDGSGGARYTVLGLGGNAASAATTFWKRTADAPTHTGLVAYTNATGEYWIGSNTRDTFSGGPYTSAATRNVTLNPVDVTGKAGLQVTVALAAAQAFEDDNYISIFADIDGPGPATYQLLTRFQGTASPNNVFPTQVGNPINALSLAFKDVTVDVPAGATNLQIKIEADGNSTAEQMAFDNIRITSSPANYTIVGGTLNISNTLLQLGTGINTINANVTTGSGFAATASAGTLVFGGSVTLPASGNASFNTAGTDITISGQVTGTGGITKTGTSNLILSNNTNNYAGTTNINGGVLRATADNALGATGSGTVVASGAQLSLVGGLTIAEPLSINGAGIGGTGALRTSGGNISYNTGVITLTGNAEIQNETGNTLTINSGINTAGFTATLDAIGPITIGGTGFSGAGGFNKISAGALNLNVASTQSGLSTINGGSVLLGANNALGSGTVALQSGTVRSSDGTARSNTSLLQFTGNVTLGDVTNNGALTFTGNALLTGDRTLTVSSAVALQGILDDGAGTFGFTKAGVGVLTLAGNNTYEGVTNAGAGTLVVAHANALGATTGGTNVSSTGRLGFSGGISTAAEPVTVYGTGTLDNLTGNNTFNGAVTLAGGVLAKLDFGATGQRVEPGYTAVGVASGDGINLTATPLSFGPLNYTIALDNLDETGVAPANSRLDWRDRGDIAPLDTLIQLGEDQVKNIGGVIHVTLAGLPAGTYSATGYHINAQATVHSSLIRVFERNGGTYTLVSPPGKTGDGSASSTALTQALVDGSRSTFTFTSNGVNNVELVFNGIGAPNGATEIDLNGLILDLTSAVGTLNLNAASGTTLTLPGAIAGSQLAVNKSGTGTVVLQGTNTYGGTTTVNAGTLVVGSDAALGNATGGTTVANSGTLAFQGNRTIAENLTTSGAATLATLSGTTNLTGTIQATTQVLPTGPIYTQLDLGAAGQVVEPGFTAVNGPAAGTFTGTFTSQTTDDFTITVDNLDAADATVGTLDWRNRGTATSALPLVQLGEDQVKNDGGVVRLTLASLPAGTYFATSYHYNSEPAVGLAMPVIVRVDSGAGYQLATPPGTPGTKISELASGALTTAAVDATKAVFTFNANGTNDVRIVFDGRPMPGDELPLNGIVLQLGQTVGSLAIDTAAGTALVLSNGISDGSATIGLTKTGSGALILNGASTYDGNTAINGGVLLVGNTIGSATGTGTVNMNPGSILLGTGIIAGTVNMNAASLISAGGGYQNGSFDDAPLNAFGFPVTLSVPPGAPLAGTLTVGSLNLAANSISTTDITSTGVDKLVVVGTVTIADGAAVGTGEIQGGVTPPASVVLLENQGAAAITGNFAQLANNTTFDFDGFQATIQYDAGVGTNDIVVTFQLDNKAPVNTVPTTPATNEDTAIAFTGLTAVSIADPDSGAAAIRTTVSAPSGVLSVVAAAGATVTNNNSGSVGIDGPQAAINATLATLMYAPPANFNGTVTINVLTDDLGNTGTGGAKTDSDDIALTVNPVNDAPTFNLAGNPPTATFNGGLQTVSNFATAIFTGAPNETQTLSFILLVTGTTGGLTFATPPAIDSTTGALTYAATNGTSGSATISVTLQDSGSGVAPNVNTSTAQTFTINVSSIVVNQPPVNTVPANAALNEDASLAFIGLNAISISDADAGTENIQTIVSVPAGQGTLSVVVGAIPGLTVTGSGTNSITLLGPLAAVNTKLASLTYSPPLNYNGGTTLTMATDDLGNTGQDGNKTATNTVTITVNPVNDAPTFNPLGTPPSSLTGSGPQTVPNFASGMSPGPADEAGQTLTFVTTITGTTGGLTFTSPPAINPATGALTYTATPGTKGTATVRAVLQDNGASAAPNVNVSLARTFVINVVGTAPLIDAPTSTVRQSPTLFTLESVNPTAVDGEPITFNIDWDGDGEVDEMVDGEFFGGIATVEVNHAFPFETPVDEPLEVIVYTTDANGDSETSSTFIDVKVFDLVVNENGFNDVVFGGTIFADRIVASLHFTGATQVSINGKNYILPDADERLIIYGGEGGDTIMIAANLSYDTILFGGNGNDYIQGGQFNDILDGGAGNDRLLPGNGNDTVIGGAGNDNISGGKGNDVIFGDAGRDSINGDVGDDIIDGGDDNDTLYGFDGNDLIRGGNGNDVIRGDRGHDILIGDAGNDSLYGGTGRDILIGGTQADQLRGSDDEDILINAATDFDADDDAMRAILFDWLRAESITARVNRLSDRLNSGTIADDGARDSLYGERDADWLIAYLSDNVVGKTADDIRTNL